MTEVIRDFIVFLFALFVMFCVWVVTGGPERYASHVGPFIKAPPPLDSGEPYSLKFGEKEPPTNTTVRDSYYLKNQTPSYIVKESLFDVRAAGVRGAVSPTQEFFTITNTSGSPQNISGLAISNESKTVAVIPRGSTLPYTGRPNAESPIILAPGETAHVISGRSPIGVSFRANKCSGYLSQFQSFTPTLTTSCPSGLEDLPRDLFGTPCESFVGSIPRCTLVLEQKTIPADTAGKCRAFVEQKIGYNSCVDIHKNDSDFYLPTWYIYLSQDTPIWRTSGVVNIVGTNKKVLGTSPF